MDYKSGYACYIDINPRAEALRRGGRRVNRKRLFLLTFVLVGLIFCFDLYARGNREGKPKTVRVTGVVRLVGTGVFPELVVTSDDGEWYIANDEMQKLYNLQHRTVTIEGEETVIDLKFAGGMSAGTRRTLSNVIVVSVSGDL